MNEDHKTLTYQQSIKYTLNFIYHNPLFKIVLVPIILLSVAAATFGIVVLEVITDIEKYFVCDLKSESAFNLMIRYMSAPFFHYILIMLNDVIVAFFISSVLRQAFCAFTNEYVLVNYDKFHSLGSGQIHAIIQRRLIAIEEFIRLLITSVLHDFIYVFVAFSKMFTDIEKRLFYSNVAMFVFYLIIIYYIMKMRVSFRLKFNQAYNLVSNTCYGILTNYDVIKSYTNEKLEIKNLDKKLEVVQDKSIVFDCLTTFAELIQKIALVIPNGLILYLGMCKIFFVELSAAGKYSLYNKIFLEVKSKIAKITQDSLKITRYLTDISDSRIVEAKLDEEYKGLPIDTFKRSIVLKRVSFYIKDIKICSNVNLTIFKGEKVAIVGKNGSGKSTLFNVLLRMRDYKGSIRIDDMEMSNISKYDQRQIISYIPQNPGIKEGTILENIKYGKEDVTNEKIIQICKDFGSHKIFSELPDGYETECGEMGKYLSGGQKQRLSFIRGVIKNADIFIFDEHTSNLDTSGQRELVDYIFTLLKFKTCLAILHNQEELPKFDKIIGLSNGKVRVYESYNSYLEDIHLY
ncbi:ABC transporter (ATM1) [Vairimorpha necatrix]|uniref:ABC transporter (ATM1) n=1 Tax=Vairimorpha necatrix TaxID=6039 RepID=A0AAX4JCH3_9MICR